MSNDRVSKAAIMSWAELEMANADDCFYAVTGNHIDPQQGAIQAEPRNWSNDSRSAKSDSMARYAAALYGMWHTAYFLTKDVESGRIE